MPIPAPLQKEWSREPAWLAELPQLAGDCATMWGIELEAPVETPHSLVVPAGDVVLKLNAPSHVEADHEADALAAWAGDSAVRLVARDDRRRALLIERCRPGTQLQESAADKPRIAAELVARLATEAARPHPFRLLADEAERWARDVPARFERHGAPFERTLVSFAVDVFRSVDRSAATLVNQDLHGGNILSATREPWLVIDPKPLVGEPELSAVGLLRNAAARGGSRAVRCWLDVLGNVPLDRERMRAWGVAHALAWGWDERRGWSQRSLEIARAIAGA